MQPLELDSLISRFSELAPGGDGKGGLLPAKWSKAEWALLFDCAELRRVASGQALIRHGDPERTLYFVLRGSLEVILPGNGMDLGALTKAAVGTVLGEIAFFDGQPRSATVWAIEDSLVAAITLERFTSFESRHPKLGRDLLFALGRSLAARMRRTESRLDGIT